MKEITGKYKITEMEQWDLDFIDAQGDGYIDFGSDGIGSFMFGYVDGDIDYRKSKGTQESKVEFSWSGNDEMDEASGRGWFEAVSGDEIYGVLCFHMGDESWVKAKKIK